MKGIKIMILTAIAVGYFTGDYCLRNEICKNAFEERLISVIVFCFVILIFNLVNEMKNCIQNKKEDKESNNQRQKIIFQDCDKERKIEEFQKERKEFFDSYFKQSSITMKTFK